MSLFIYKAIVGPDNISSQECVIFIIPIVKENTLCLMKSLYWCWLWLGHRLRLDLRKIILRFLLIEKNRPDSEHLTVIAGADPNGEAIHFPPFFKDKGSD